MVTLAGEIFYHKHKASIDNKLSQIKPGKKTKVETLNYQSKMMNNQPKNRITLGENNFNDYRPTGPGKTMPRVSYISVFPRNTNAPYN